MKTRYSSLAKYLDLVETQDALAERLQVTQPTISRAKQGKGSYRILKRISDATGVPLKSFATKVAA